MMMDNSNCSAIQTPYIHHPDIHGIQYLRVRGIRINGRWDYQTEEAIAVDWRGVYASSELSYIWVQTWLGPSYVTGQNADTNLNQLYSLFTATDSYACQFNDVNQVSGQGGFMLIKDIYCEQTVKRDRVTRGNAFLFNRLVAVSARGLHTEYVACPITLRACQCVSIDGASGYGDGFTTAAMVPEAVCPEGALIHVDSVETFYHLHIGPYSAALKATGIQVFNSAPGVGAGVFPNTAGTEGSGGVWGGINTTNNLVAQGWGGISYGQITSGWSSTAGNPQSVHPRNYLRSSPYMPGDHFWEEFRVDFNVVLQSSQIGGVDRNHIRWGAYDSSYAVGIYDPLAFVFSNTLADNYTMGRNGEELYYKNATSTRKVLMEGDAVAITGKIVPGAGISITGSGTDADPYVVSIL
jgi:hypothetical protein